MLDSIDRYKIFIHLIGGLGGARINLNYL